MPGSRNRNSLNGQHSCASLARPPSAHQAIRVPPRDAGRSPKLVEPLSVATEDTPRPEDPTPASADQLLGADRTLEQRIAALDDDQQKRLAETLRALMDDQRAASSMQVSAKRSGDHWRGAASGGTCSSPAGCRERVELLPDEARPTDPRGQPHCHWRCRPGTLGFADKLELPVQNGLFDVETLLPRCTSRRRQA